MKRISIQPLSIALLLIFIPPLTQINHELSRWLIWVPVLISFYGILFNYLKFKVKKLKSNINYNNLSYWKGNEFNEISYRLDGNILSKKDEANTSHWSLTIPYSIIFFVFLSFAIIGPDKYQEKHESEPVVSKDTSKTPIKVETDLNMNIEIDLNSTSKLESKFDKANIQINSDQINKRDTIIIYHSQTYYSFKDLDSKEQVRLIKNKKSNIAIKYFEIIFDVYLLRGYVQFIRKYRTLFDNSYEPYHRNKIEKIVPRIRYIDYNVNACKQLDLQNKNYTQLLNNMIKIYDDIKLRDKHSLTGLSDSLMFIETQIKKALEIVNNSQKYFINENIIFSKQDEKRNNKLEKTRERQVKILSKLKRKISEKKDEINNFIVNDKKTERRLERIKNKTDKLYEKTLDELDKINKTIPFFNQLLSSAEYNKTSEIIDSTEKNIIIIEDDLSYVLNEFELITSQQKTEKEAQKINVRKDKNENADNTDEESNFDDVKNEQNTENIEQNRLASKNIGLIHDSLAKDTVNVNSDNKIYPDTNYKDSLKILPEKINEPNLSDNGTMGIMNKLKKELPFSKWENDGLFFEFVNDSICRSNYFDVAKKVKKRYTVTYKYVITFKDDNGVIQSNVHVIFQEIGTNANKTILSRIKILNKGEKFSIIKILKKNMETRGDVFHKTE